MSSLSGSFFCLKVSCLIDPVGRISFGSMKPFRLVSRDLSLLTRSSISLADNISSPSLSRRLKEAVNLANL